MALEPTRNNFSNSYLIFYFLLSIAFSSMLLEPVLIPRQLVLSLFCLALLYFYTKDLLLTWNHFVENWNRTFLIIVSLIFLSVCLSTLFSFNTSLAISVSSKYLIELLFLVLTVQLLRIGKITIKHLGIGVLMFSIVQLVSGAFQSLDILNQGLSIIDNKEITGLAANKNLYASCLFLTLPFIVYYSIVVSQRFLKIASILGLLLTLFLIYILQSKTVYVGLLISLISVAVLILLFYTKQWPFRKKLYIGFIFILILSLAISVIYNQKKTYFTQISHQNIALTSAKDIDKHTDNTTLLVRFALWKNSFQIIQESPFLGKGPGNWILFFPKYGLQQMKDLGVENGTVVFQNPHNDWILLLSEIGFIGFICYFLFYVYGVYIAFKNIIYQEDKKIKLINLLILSTWIGLFVIHSADFPLERIEHQVLIYTMYAIVMYSYSIRSKDSTSRKAQFGRIFSIFFFLISIFSSIVGFNRWQSEKEMKEIKELMATNRWDLVLEKSRKLENVFYTMDPTTMPIDWYTGVAFFNLQQYSVALAYFKKAYEINPYNVHVISNYAACYTKLNALGKAAELYKKGLLISPRFDDLRLNLCVVYYKQAMYKEAMNCLLNCAYDKYSSDARFRSYVIEVTRAYLGNKQMLPSSAEKYFVSLKNT